MTKPSIVNIWISASDGDLEAVKNFIENGISVNAQDEYGYCPLSAAVSYDHYELAQYLIENGADIMLGDFDKETPLHYCETARCAELLIKHGADPNAKNLEMLNPYQTALRQEFEELASYLKPLTEDIAEEEQVNPLKHTLEDINDQGEEVELNPQFINNFERILKDSEINNEEERDKQLGDLVLNLIGDKFKGDKKA